jgi:type II secretory pathway pseudopilin PulG
MSTGRRDEHGFTMVELSVALMLTVLILSALFGVFYAFSQNAADQGRQAALQRESREAMAEMVTWLRQSVGKAPGEHPVESLTADRIVFYSDVDERDGPERVVVERTDCSDGFCQLNTIKYGAVAGSGPEWTFEAQPLAEVFMLARVHDDVPLFQGVTWVGDPKVKAHVAACGGTQPRCRFPIVAITLRAEPTGTSEGARLTFEMREEVTLRNAP